MVTEVELCESPDLTPLDFCLWAWMRGELYGRKTDTRDELLARSFGCCYPHEET